MWLANKDCQKPEFPGDDPPGATRSLPRRGTSGALASLLPGTAITATLLTGAEGADVFTGAKTLIAVLVNRCDIFAISGAALASCNDPAAIHGP